MSSQIVVAFRMPLAGLSTTGLTTSNYLTRARSLCARGEALGGQLVGWSDAILAVAWDIDSEEEAILLATSIHGESLDAARDWACGMAEGALEPLAPDGQRMHLAWGAALLTAVSLARVARPGEMLVDGDVRALREGRLALAGVRSSTRAGRRVRGWRLDLENPWIGDGADAQSLPDATDRLTPVLPPKGPPASGDLASAQEHPAADFASEEVSSATVLQLVEASMPTSPTLEARDTTLVPPRSGAIAERVRALADGGSEAGAIEALAELRRARMHVEGAPPAARCQASLALAMTLGIVGRTEEALIEALDALARAREAHEPKAVGACMALLSKLYSSAGFPDAATRLRESTPA